MTKVAVIQTNDRVYGVNKSFELLGINPVKGKTVVETPGHQPGMLPPFLSQKGVNVVIAGGMGPRAQNLFKQMNIEPIIGVTGKVDPTKAYIARTNVLGGIIDDELLKFIESLAGKGQL